MADTKISALPAATLPLAGTEVLPIVQGGTTDKIAVDDLTVRNFRANATTGILQVTGPAAASTRVMTVPDANFTALFEGGAIGGTTPAAGNFTNLSFNAGFGSVALAYGCRAWCLFNGTGTPAIRASANISSITDNGTGSYDLNFTNAMPDGNFAVAAISDGFGVANGGAVSSSTARGNSTSKVAILVAQQSGSPADFPFVHVAIFR